MVIALSADRMRFRDLRATVDGISSKVLTETLRDLERDGIVTRHVYAEVPPRVEYELTALGRSLQTPLLALSRWAEEHIADVLAEIAGLYGERCKRGGSERAFRVFVGKRTRPLALRPGSWTLFSNVGGPTRFTVVP